MSSMVSQITNVSSVYSNTCSGADQRKHQHSASLAFVRGIHRGPVNSPHKGPVTRKMFPFDYVIMTSIYFPEMFKLRHHDNLHGYYMLCSWISLWYLVSPIPRKYSFERRFVCKIDMRDMSLIAKFMETTRGPSGADRTHEGPMLVPWILLSGQFCEKYCFCNCVYFYKKCQAF